MASTIWTIANRLPLTLGAELSQTRRSSGGLVSALEGLDGPTQRLRWVGWPGAEVPVERQQEVCAYLESHAAATPVFLSAEEEAGFYEGFSNSSLWPLLHYMPTRLRTDARWWAHYERVNRRFADATLAAVGEADVVWVHDYHLMLLPKLLKEAKPSLRVGFFLHTPFPSFEVFRCLPQREALIEGLLGADLIGFHTFGYMRHFRSCVLRLLGIDAGLDGIRHGGRVTRLGVFPIGIPAAKFAEQLATPEHAQNVRDLAASHVGKQIVLSVERMDYTKGILHRLDAIDEFLQSRTPEQREAVRFIFVGVPSRSRVQAYQTLREDVESAVGRINGKYSTLHGSPIQFIHGSVNFPELCAMYALADVCMVTPLIDGMNLVAKEFVACQRISPMPRHAIGPAASSPDTSAEPEADRCGVLVLSEFAGAAIELHSALVVNPYDLPGVVSALEQALAMPDVERRRRMREMRQRVMRHDAAAWGRTFIDSLMSQPAGTDVSGADLDGGPVLPSLRGARDRIDRVLATGGRVAMFLDYDGTLREIERDPAAAVPTDAIRRTLAKLSACASVDLTIISGRRADDLDRWFHDVPFTLVAEHGASIRRPGASAWTRLGPAAQYPWIEQMLPLLELYADSTPGTFVEVKHTGLVWHYRKADPDFGAWKAKELAEELSSLAANVPVSIRHGRKIVEVAAADISKANAVLRLLDEQATAAAAATASAPRLPQGPYDLVLCAGDDVTDESMFQLEQLELISVKVGVGDTAARYRAPSPAVLRSLLDAVVARAAARDAGLASA